MLHSGNGNKDLQAAQAYLAKFSVAKLYHYRARITAVYDGDTCTALPRGDHREAGAAQRERERRPGPSRPC